MLARCFGAAIAMGVLIAPVSSAQAPALIDLRTEIIADSEVPIPRFQVDPAWPDVPDDLILGQVAGVAVDGDDDVWIVQRPGSLAETEVGLAQSPPTAVCCRPAAPVLQFSADGALLTAWGGPDAAPEVDGVSQWPASMHGVFIDADEAVWLAGNGEDDHVVLRYTQEGEYHGAFGRRARSGGDRDRQTLGRPADIFHDGASGEVLVADGYGNHRVIGFDADTKEFTRYWGALGEEPVARSQNAGGGADPDAPSFANPVHCVVKTSDDHIYVCDRANNRLQLFREAGGGAVELVRTIALAPTTGGTGTATDVALSPDETYLYVADMMNGRIWILLRETHEVLAAIGRIGRYAGEFTWLHSIDVDSAGNIYTGEVSDGRRAQKLVLIGVE